MNLMKMILLATAAAMAAAPCPAQESALTTATIYSQRSTTGPLPADWTTVIEADQFTSVPGAWLAPEITALFPFDELIYSWNIHQPEGEAFRLGVKVTFPDGEETAWLPAGYWGDMCDPLTSMTKPTFDRGEVDMDWVKLTERAKSFQFRVTNAGISELTVLPRLHVITTDNRPTTETRALASAQPPAAGGIRHARVLDLPFRRQMNSAGVITPNKCQSAALASAMEYFGKPIPLEDIVAHTWDPEYNYPGLWPRVIGAANEFGFDGRIARYRDWDAVRASLARNEIILCSIRLRKGEAEAPPYESMGNHIVALNGITTDGQVVVTDSFLGKSGRGYRCQWLLKDFEKVWMQTKSGVAMVIEPPADAEAREIATVPPFPKDRVPITGDDH